MKRSAPLARTAPMKRGGKPRKESARTARKKADLAWSQYVRARDNYTCQYCGRTDRLMNAHHVMIREFSATRCDPRNGITVCGIPCHTQVMHGQPNLADAFYYRHLGPVLLAEIRQKGYEGVGAKYGAPHWQAELENLRRLSALLEEHR